jgi:azurin
MNLSGWFRTIGVTVVTAVALTACGGGGGGGGGGAAGGPLAVGSDGENLAYAPATLSAPAGDVQIAFKNNSASQQHNLVLVRGGDDVAAQVAAAGVSAGPPNYLPSGDANVVAATQMLNGGGEESITASGLTAGTYTYICTFPGHYPAMKGTLTVQ